MAQTIDGPVSNDGEEPTLDRTLLGIVLALRPPNGDECVLDNIFGGGLFAKDLKGKAVRDPTVGVVQALDPVDRWRGI